MVRVCLHFFRFVLLCLPVCRVCLLVCLSVCMSVFLAVLFYICRCVDMRTCLYVDLWIWVSNTLDTERVRRYESMLGKAMRCFDWPVSMWKMLWISVFSNVLLMILSIMRTAAVSSQSLVTANYFVFSFYYGQRTAQPTLR